MNPLLLICAVISVVVACMIFLPFFTGPGGFLQDASASDNIETLKAREAFILERWLRDEEAANAGEISKLEWSQRQRYLTSRYVDVVRRISWLEGLQASGDSQSEVQS